MELFVDLDVSVRTTSICVMEAGGKILKAGKVESHPASIADFLSNIAGHYKWVGLEAGPLSQWLYAGLAEAGYPVIYVKTARSQEARMLLTAPRFL